MKDDQTKTCPMCGALFGIDASRCTSCGESFANTATETEDDPTRGLLIATAGSCMAIVGICSVLKAFTPLLSGIPWWVLIFGPAISFAGIFIVLAGINLISRRVRR
jgi:hypothetical protein